MLKEIANELSERKKTVSHRGKNKIFYKTFYLNLLPLFVINSHGIIIYKNYEANKLILKNSKNEIQELKLIFLSEEQELFNDNFKEAAKTGETINISLNILTDLPSPIPVMCSIIPMPENNNKNHNFLILLRDITYQKQIESQLIHAQKMEVVGLFTGSIAHDFNNMLTAIIGYSDILIESYNKKDLLYNYMVEIKKAGERAALLSSKLLRFSRKQKLTPAAIDINALIKDLNGMIQRLIGEKIQLSISMDETPCYVRADLSQLEQMIMNLVINARDAMTKGGNLSIDIKSIFIDKNYAVHYASLEPGTYVTISVTDTGIGMNEEIHKHIFDPFFTTKKKGQGTGLGLSTVYGIVKQWEGNIFVYSKPNNGTTFKIFLPEINYTPKHVYNAPYLNENLYGNETILLVEDDDIVRRLVKHLLTEYGYTVKCASRPNDAIDIVESLDKSIDLLISDVIMPEMNGDELAEKILIKYPNIKVIYISGYSNSTFDKFNKDSYSHIYLQKPLTPSELLIKTRELLGKLEENKIV